MTRRKRTQYIHEGKYVAEVEIEVIVNEDEWSPYLTLEDAYRLDELREALRRGDFVAAAENAVIYELHPLAIGRGAAQPGAPTGAHTSRR